MSAGTLTLTNNSARVSGNGTSFSTELAAGDFIVMKTGGVTYTLPVKTVESDSALTLSRPYAGPAVSGSAWTAMPRDTLNSISAQIATDTAYAIRQRVLEIDNWYQLLEVNGDITIKMADGSTYTGPSWLRIIDIMKAMKIEDLIPLADQIHTDAAQVAADKPVIIQAKADAEAAAASALISETASSGYATSADSAKTAAEVAQEKAEKAAQDAASHNPVAALAKANNLSDLEDRAEAWLNVRPDGPTPLAADPVDDKDAATKGWVKTFIASVKSVLASWSVIKNDATAPANNATAYGGELVSDYQVAGVSVAKAALTVKNTVGGRVDPVIRMTDARGSTPTTYEYNLASAGNNSGSGGNSLNIVTFVGPGTQIVTRRFPVTAPANASTSYTYNWVSEGARQFSNYPGVSVVGESGNSGSWRVAIEGTTNDIVTGFIHNSGSSQVTVWVNVIAIGSIKL